MTQLADRFITAWKLLEQDLGTRWSAAKERRVPDSESLIRWAERSGQVSANTATFLQACRRARNAYAHVAFEDYVGPITLPPEPVVHRLERVVSTLRSPARARSRAEAATACAADTSVQEALRIMRQCDFSQLPYWHPTAGWLLVTREQVACWVEISAESAGHVLVDLAAPVRELSDHPAVGPVVPRIVAPGAPLTEALEQLEETLEIPDDQPGGYPAVLVATNDANGPVRILTVDDLPRIYEVMGR